MRIGRPYSDPDTWIDPLAAFVTGGAESARRRYHFSSATIRTMACRFGVGRADFRGFLEGLGLKGLIGHVSEAELYPFVVGYVSTRIAERATWHPRRVEKVRELVAGLPAGLCRQPGDGSFELFLEDERGRCEWVPFVYESFAWRQSHGRTRTDPQAGRTETTGRSASARLEAG